MLSYNIDMYNNFDDSSDLLIVPRLEHWSGAQIHQLLQDMERQYAVASHLNISMEAKSHYRDLFVKLVKTYGH
jgi:hypothetical protein